MQVSQPASRFAPFSDIVKPKRTVMGILRPMAPCVPKVGRYRQLSSPALCQLYFPLLLFPAVAFGQLTNLLLWAIRAGTASI
jgi:hypothetical protein